MLYAACGIALMRGDLIMIPDVEMSEQLCVKISKKLQSDLIRIIPGKMKSTIVRCLLEQLVEEVEEHGKSVLGDILDKKFNIRGQ